MCMGLSADRIYEPTQSTTEARNHGEMVNEKTSGQAPPRLLGSGTWLGVADFLDGRGDDGSVIFGMAKFEVHAAAYVLKFEHGTTPSGTGDGDLDWVGAEFGMAGKQRFTASQKNGSVAVVKGLDLEDGGGRKIVEKDAAFDFGLDDGVVDVVG